MWVELNRKGLVSRQGWVAKQTLYNLQIIMSRKRMIPIKIKVLVLPVHSHVWDISKKTVLEKFSFFFMQGNNWGSGPQSAEIATDDCLDNENRLGCGPQETFRYNKRIVYVFEYNIDVPLF